MIGRMAVLAAAIALAGCAGMESAGRNAQRAPAPAAAPLEAPPAQQASLPPPQAPAAEAPAPSPALTAPPPPSAAPPAPAATQAAQRDEDEDDDAIVVPGQRETQVPAPGGDPRSVAERAEDVRAWDRCITSAQDALDSDPMRPQLDSPEEYCSRSLGMASRGAVPESRRQR
jgi:hypothetical protein